jgi:Amt family ammonium transporter
MAVNTGAANGLVNGNPAKFVRQLVAVGITIGFVAVGTFLVCKLVGLITSGLRASAEDEENGLDVTEHGEVGYSGDSAGTPAVAGFE